jgi:hypothetical protein
MVLLDGRLWWEVQHQVNARRTTLVGGAASKISMAVGIGTKTSCGSYVEKSITPGFSSFEFLAARHDVTKKMTDGPVHRSKKKEALRYHRNRNPSARDQ